MYQHVLEDELKWEQRRFRHLSRKYKINADVIEEEMQSKSSFFFQKNYFL